MAKLKKQAKIRKSSTAPQKRTYLKQSDVPNASLDEALRIPHALFDHYAGKAASPMQVAKALNMAPNGSQIIVLSGAAIAFGLIEGGAQASSISPTDISRRILRPRSEGEDIQAKQEAVLKPRIFNEFLKNYDGSPFPRRDISQNVLEGMGVPRDRTEEVLDRILSSAQSVGFVDEIKGKQYFSLHTLGTSGAISSGTQAEEAQQPTAQESNSGGHEVPEVNRHNQAASPSSSSALTLARLDDARRSRVFITHGKNVVLVEPIKKLLEFGELDPVISVKSGPFPSPFPKKLWTI